MRLRSLLFVPGDRPERFRKAAASGADAVILDLEDAVAPSAKEAARRAVVDFLQQKPEVPTLVRVNALDTAMIDADLAAVAAGRPDAVMLPKAEGADSILALDERLDACSRGGFRLPQILPIAAETPGAIFALGSFRDVRDRLMGLTWGAEDLPSSIGATTGREADGSFTQPLALARSMTLFAAHRAGVAAIDTVFPAIKEEDRLSDYAARARRDGFTGMMAIHPDQVRVINAAFTPTSDEIERAETIVRAFADNPGAGVLQIDGKMVDAPHLKQAVHLLGLVR